MNALVTHTSLSMLEEGYTPADVEGEGDFQHGFLAGTCLMLFAETPNMSVAQAQLWVEGWFQKLPKSISLLVLTVVFDDGVPADFQAYLKKARKSSFLGRSVTVVALDQQGRKVVGRLDALESAGLLGSLRNALKSFDPAASYDAEALARRQTELLEQTRAAAVELLKVRPLVTYATVGACLLTFGLMTAAGGSENNWTLLRFGANFAPLDRAGQFWRWGSSMFVHIGFFHILVNMYSLYAVGPALERVLGNRRFAALYAVSGLAGGLASTYFGKGGLSAGASGAIFGLFGAGLYIDRYWKAELPGPLRKQLFSGLGPTILYNLIIGFSSSFIDNAAHLGGLLGGVAYMLVARRFRPGWLGAIPLLCLLWALSQAARYPTPASYPTHPVQTPGVGFTVHLPSFMLPTTNEDGTITYAGPGFAWFNNSVPPVADEPIPDLSKESDAAEMLKGMGQSVASHELKKLGGRDWLIWKVDYPEEKVGYMGVTYAGRVAMVPGVVTIKELEEPVHELFLKTLEGLEAGP